MRSIVAAGALLPVVAWGQSTTVDLAWQGRVLDAAGTPIEGVHDVDIDLWTDATGGTSIHTASFPAHVVEQGYLSVVLHDVPASAFVGANGAPRFLWTSVAIDGSDVLEPRQPMNTVPYAANLVGGSATLSGKLFLGTADEADCGAGAGEGALIYDSARHVPRFCNGDRWIDIGRLTIRTVGGAREWSDGTVAQSCAAYRYPPPGAAYDGDVGDGYYRVDPDGPGSNPPVVTWCDQTTDGGGWTAVLQCLPSDTCRVGNTRLYGISCRASDHGSANDGASWLLGASMDPLTTAARQFMTEIRRTSDNATGYLIYPMHLGFFTASPGKSESGDVTVRVIDADGSVTSRTMRSCWSSNNATYDVRSYRAEAGMTFLDATAETPSTTANADCDYGPWASQALVRVHRTSTTGQTTTFGKSPHTGWNQSAFAHRIFIR